MLEAREKLWVRGTSRKSSASGERLDWLSAVTLSAVHLSHEQRFYGRNRPTVLYLLPLFCVFQSSTTRPCRLLLKHTRKLLLFLKMFNAGCV